jgi:C_GCAxxG_C_C family probable redox protein
MEQVLRKYWDKSKYNLSCSETMLHAANEYYNLGLDEKTFKIMAPFSGGMFEGETCGVVTGGISVIGVLLTKDNKANSPQMIQATKEFKQRFKDELKSRDCTPLKAIYEDESVGCGNLIYAGGKILAEVIAKYQK